MTLLLGSVLAANMLCPVSANSNSVLFPLAQQILYHVSDVIYFGAIEPCNKCKNGRFVFNGNSAYRCNGVLSGFGDCCEINISPTRRPVKIDDLVRDEHPFLSEHNVKERAVKAAQAGQQFNLFEKFYESEAEFFRDFDSVQTIIKGDY